MLVRSPWLPYLSHRDCQARSHLERLSYFVHNPKIRAETFYSPLIKHFLSVWSGEALELTLDTSMLWDKFCLIKDYKSAGFELVRSHLRDAQALTCVLMLLATAQLFALHLGLLLTQLGQRYQIDWHGARGLSFLQLGLRQLQRLCYQGLPIPLWRPLPRCNPPPACASRRKREALACQIEFSRVTVFSG